MVSQLFKADIKVCGAGIERRELQDQSRMKELICLNATVIL